MTPYQTSYAIRYNIPSIQKQIEAAAMVAAQDILNEDPATPDHANREQWAAWAYQSSSVAWVPFGWAVAMNATIMSAVEADSSGSTVADSDVQFVVNGALPKVIDQWAASQPAKSP
jgi:hypothetical protein